MIVILRQQNSVKQMPKKLHLQISKMIFVIEMIN